VLTILLEPK